MKKRNYLALAKTAAGIADDKKGKDIVILNVNKLTNIADYFLIVTAESAPQINAIVDTIFRTFKEKEGVTPLHTEGKDSSSWAALDYGPLVIHVMSPETRNVYSLEKIWSEGRKVSMAAAAPGAKPATKPALKTTAKKTKGKK